MIRKGIISEKSRKVEPLQGFVALRFVELELWELVGWQTPLVVGGGVEQRGWRRGVGVEDIPEVDEWVECDELVELVALVSWVA